MMRTLPAETHVYGSTGQLKFLKVIYNCDIYRDNCCVALVSVAISKPKNYGIFTQKALAWLISIFIF